MENKEKVVEYKYPWQQREAERRPLKVKLIASQSEKRKSDQRAYLKIVDRMLKENPMCEIKETGCTGRAQGLHHRVKRSPATLLDETKLMRACNNCNLWVELHPLDAINKGYSISKFKK